MSLRSCGLQVIAIKLRAEFCAVLAGRRYATETALDLDAARGRRRVSNFPRRRFHNNAPQVRMLAQQSGIVHPGERNLRTVELCGKCRVPPWFEHRCNP